MTGRACLRIAEDIGMPVVVSSAVETSVGIAAGVALAAALPELDYACGLATVQLLAGDVSTESLLPVEGALPVRPVSVDDTLLARYRGDEDRAGFWVARHEEVAKIAATGDGSNVRSDGSVGSDA